MVRGTSPKRESNGDSEGKRDSKEKKKRGGERVFSAERRRPGLKKKRRLQKRQKKTQPEGFKRLRTQEAPPCSDITGV